MKNRIFKNWSLGFAVALLPLAGGCLQQSAIPVETVASSTPAGDNLQKLDLPQPEDALTSTKQTAETGLSDAPTKLISAQNSPPPSIRATEALSALIQLAESGVEESVMLSYVTHSIGAFSLGAEEIIYLNDIGVPASVVSAMLQHDHLLVDNAAVAARSALEAPPEPASPALPPAPAEAALPADYISNNMLAPGVGAPSEPDFYDALAPYGNWVNVEGSGRCWQPSVVAINHDWRPYCDRGHWVYTDCGWYWASDYSWGWAPFHYGRWFRHNNLGWCWTPDNVWGPSWVSWRYSNDYCGWAPLPPVACFRPGLGFSYRGHSVGFSFNFGVAASCYTFVPTRNFCDSRLSRHALPREDVTRIFHDTIAVNKIVGDHNRIANYGIPAERITAVTHAHLRQIAVRGGNQEPGPGIRPERFEPQGGTLAVRSPGLAQLPRTPSTISGSSVVSGSGIAQNPPLTTEGSSVTHRFDQESRVTPVSRSAQNHPTRTEIARSTGVDLSERVSRQDKGSPLIIRGPSRVATANQSARTIGLEASAQTQRSFAPNYFRSVEGRPRYERPESAYRTESFVSHSEVPSRWNATPSAPVHPAAPEHFATFENRPRIETPRYESAPSHAPQPSSFRESAVVNQPQISASQSSSPAHTASSSFAASSHNQSSSDKHGR